MPKTKRLHPAVLWTLGAMAAIVLLGSAPLILRGSVAEARDIPLGCTSKSCVSAAGWSCCWYNDGTWFCDENCKPSETLSLGKNRECIGIAPGKPIPLEIQRDLDRQAKKFGSQLKK